MLLCLRLAAHVAPLLHRVKGHNNALCFGARVVSCINAMCLFLLFVGAAVLTQGGGGGAAGELFRELGKMREALQEAEEGRSAATKQVTI